MLYESTYMNFLKGQNYSAKNPIYILQRGMGWVE